MIKTVNVIEFADDDLLGITAFEDTPDGNKEAEAHFRAGLVEAGVTAEDIDSFVEDGYWEQGTYQVFLSHSSQELTMSEATRDTYGHLDDQELVYLALQSIIEELDYWKVPQLGADDEFGDDTALGFCRNVLKWVKLPEKS